MSIAYTTACVVPIPASPSEDRDAGAGNDTPTIISATPINFPGPLDLVPSSPQQFTVTLRDANIGETLYIVVVRDYLTSTTDPIFIDAKPIPNDPLLGKPERTTTLSTANWCNSVTGSEGQLIFDITVADQPFDQDTTKQPVYRVVTNGGRSSVRSWVVRCAQPPS